MNSSNLSSENSKSNYVFSITIIGVLFFIFGFVTWLNSTLIPFLKISCELTSYTQALLVTSAFYISYFVMAPVSAAVLHKTGFKNGMSLGLFIMAIGSIIFVPAALTRTFGLFLTGLFIQGTGLTLLQTAVNPYVTIIGPHKSAAKRISIMGICNKVAGALSPLIIGFIILENADKIVETLKTITGVEREVLLTSLAHRVILPYVIMAVVLTGLAVMIYFVHLPEIDTDTEDSLAADGSVKTSLWQFPQLILGFIALLVYVGVEVMAGDTIILYGQSQGIPLATARTFATYTMLSMIVGYLLGIMAIPRYISQSRALAISAILGVVMAVAAILTSGYVSVACIALLGLANALMWPAIWPLAIADLGKFTKAGSALLIMGIVGGATIPLLYGSLAEAFHNYQQAYWIMVPIYLYILYYATFGYKIRK
jgi:MFS transporter, FHS family, L-fucose permease